MQREPAGGVELEGAKPEAAGAEPAQDAGPRAHAASMAGEDPVGRKALAALTAYIARGEAALEVLAHEGGDAFFKALHKRDIAFHNFAALDALARHRGLELAQDAAVLQLMAEAQAQNTRLADLMEAARLELDRRMAVLGRVERDARAYLSGATESARLVKLA